MIANPMSVWFSELVKFHVTVATEFYCKVSHAVSASIRPPRQKLRDSACEAVRQTDHEDTMHNTIIKCSTTIGLVGRLRYIVIVLSLDLVDRSIYYYILYNMFLAQEPR